MKWTVFFVVMLILLLPQPLLFSYTQPLDNDSVKLVESTNYGLTSNGYVDVDVSEAKQMIESNPNLVILDVRTQEEYDEGHIEDAVLIPVGELESRLDELGMEDEILVYCRSGVRSATASQMLVDNGFTSVYNVLGGLTAWRDAGYWIEIIHRGDLIIDDYETFVIDNCTYIQTGNILVSDYGKLIVRNGKLELNQSYHTEYGIFIERTGSLEMSDVEMISPRVFPVDVKDSATVRINNVVTNGRFECHGNSATLISNSTLFADQHVGDSAEVVISKSVLHSEIGLHFSKFSTITIRRLEPGFLEFWNIYKNASVHNVFNLTIKDTNVDGWTLTFPYDIIRAEVKNSVISCLWLDFSNVEINVDNLKTGFQTSWNLLSIYLVNSSITDQWGFILTKVNATFSNCIIGLLLLESNEISIRNSTLRWLILDRNEGILCFNRTILYEVLLWESSLYFYGDIRFKVGIGNFVSSNVIRNYNIIVMNKTTDLIPNAELSLYDENNTIIWNDFTDNLGQANFNVTFTDSNYTDALKLEAVKGNYSATINVSFLSDTPIILTMRYFTDLNGDGTINIQDIFIVAKAFGTKERDENYNPIADLDANKEINIIDLYKVATEYGKTV